jgi:hypothetical protein
MWSCVIGSLECDGILKECSTIKMSAATCPVTRHHIPEHLHVRDSAWTWGMTIKNNVLDSCSEIRTQGGMDSFKFGLSEKSCFSQISIKITYKCPLTLWCWKVRSWRAVWC